MKKITKAFLSLAALCSLGLVACQDTSSSSSSPVSSSPTTSVTTSSSSTKTQDELDLEVLESIEFKNAEVTYDGNEHSLLVTSLPEGVSAQYSSNTGTNAGKYNAEVVLSKGNQSVTKKATLTINKAKPVITAELNQTLVNYGHLQPVATVNGDSVLTYTWYKDGKKLANQNVHTAGEYTVKITAKATKNYQIPKSVEVNVKVVDSLYGLDFVSETYTYDGTPKELKLVGDIPSNVTVEYIDNVATEAGTYYAKALVKDLEGNVVETHAAVMNIVHTKNADFEAFCDEFFVWYLEGDQYSCNVFMENPKDFGLDHYDAKWYTYTRLEDIEEAIEHDKKLYLDLLNTLETFKDAPLSPEQMITYQQIEDNLTYQIEYLGIKDILFLENRYIDQFGGYVSDLNSCVIDYAIRNEQDLIDVIDFIESTSEAFPSYLEYLKDKTAAGYGLSDVTIDGMVAYLDDLLEEEEYYLIEILRQKIDGLSFLTAEQKASYKAEVEVACNTHLVPAIKTLREGVVAYKGSITKDQEGYWTACENGLELYTLELGNLLGYSDFDLAAYLEVLDAALIECYDIYNSSSSIAGRTFSNINSYLENNPIYLGTPEEMVQFLKEFAPTIVPELETDPEVVVKNMDDARAKVETAVAYYRKSPLDNTGAEYITLNQRSLAGATAYELLGTIAHEGYPGHLYAYCYSKELDLHPFSTIKTSTAHAEGWATYVEFQLYEYAKQIHSDIPNYNIAMDYLYGTALSNYMLEARIDLGIFYEGWEPEDINACLQRVMPGYSYNDVNALYNQFLEMPTVYHSYGYGKYVFYSYHQEAKKYLGDSYDEVEFNAMLLSKGWTNLSILEETYFDYMNAKCHELGIEFEGKKLLD